MSDETGTPLLQLLALVKEMSTRIATLAENQDKLVQQQNNNAKAIADLLVVAHNHAETLRVAQQAVERLWKECGLPFDPPPAQAN